MVLILESLLKLFSLTIVFLFTFIILGCKQETNVNSNQTSVTNSAEAKNTPGNINVTLEFKAENLKERKPKIVGKTNLPDGIKLLIVISGVSVNYNSKETVSVKNGAFETGNFSKNNALLTPGQYMVDISTIEAKMQTPEVRQIIGENGENLAGSPVKKDKLDGLGSIVKGRLTFVLN